MKIFLTALVFVTIVTFVTSWIMVTLAHYYIFPHTGIYYTETPYLDFLKGLAGTL